MNYKIHTIKSGLRILTSEVSSLPSVAITVWVKTGSRNEEKRVNGISHFLEHMVFKGSSKRPSAREISTAVDSIGGEFNAGTSKDWTNFYIKTRVGNIETAMDVLSDMVFNPLLKTEEIEREKGTILQEIAMYEDTPMAKIGEVFEELAFDGSPLGWDTAGSPKSVMAIKRDDFLKYRNKFYYPENMLVSISGGIKEEEALKLAEKYFSGIQNKRTAELQTGKKFLITQNKPQLKLKTKDNDQAHIIVGFMSEGRGYKGRFAQSVLSTILGGGMSSRLFIEVRERRGLAYAVKPSGDRFSEVGYVGTYAGVDTKKVDEAITVILEQYYGITNSKYPISMDEMKKAKEYLKGHIALSLEDTQAVGDFFAEQVLFQNEILTPEEIYKKIDAVSVEEVYFEAEKLFKREKLNLAVIGPYKDGGKFKKLI